MASRFFILLFFLGMLNVSAAPAEPCNAGLEASECQSCRESVAGLDEVSIVGICGAPKTNSLICDVNPLGESCIACLIDADANAASPTNCTELSAQVDANAPLSCPDGLSRLKELSPRAMATVQNLMVSNSRLAAQLEPFEAGGNTDCDLLPAEMLEEGSDNIAGYTDAELEKALSTPRSIHQCLLDRIDFFKREARSLPTEPLPLKAVFELTIIQSDVEEASELLNDAHALRLALTSRIDRYRRLCRFR